METYIPEDLKPTSPGKFQIPNQKTKRSFGHSVVSDNVMYDNSFKMLVEK